MNILALDLGEKRIGIAHGSTRERIAFPTQVIEKEISTRKEDIFKEIVEICHNRQIQKTLIGHPAPLSEIGSHQTQTCRDFADDLEDFFVFQKEDISVELADETFSTKIAQKKLKDIGYSSREQKYKKDAIAAAEFLQMYFDLQKA